MGARGGAGLWPYCAQLFLAFFFFACQPQKQSSGGFTFSTQNPWKVLQTRNEPSCASGVCVAEHNQ